MNESYEIYHVSNPTSAIGVHGDLHWAVSLNGDWQESFRTRRGALEHVAQRLGTKPERLRLRKLEGRPSPRYRPELKVELHV